MSYESDKEFQRCVKFVLEMECGKNKDGSLKDGYVNDPADPGGETKFGISKRAFPGHNIRDLNLGDALRIYYEHYWYIGKSEPFPVNLVVFDTAVNQGTKRAAGFLLSCRGDWRCIIEQRRQHYLAIIKSNPTLKKFQKGWMNRLNEVAKFAEIEMKKEDKKV